MRLMTDLEYIASRSHQTLGHSKSGRQFVIFAGGPHDDRNTMTFDADLERFFGSQAIPVVGKGRAVHPPHGDFSHLAAERGWAFHKHSLPSN